MTPVDPSRRSDIDILRILATYLLFPFHVAMIFNPAPFYHVRNDELSIVPLIFTGFVSLWHMPLFFLLAGWSAVKVLRTRTAMGFAAERVRRLIVPLLLGCVLFAPAIKYVELLGGQDLNHRGLFVAPELASSYESVIPQGFPAMAPFDETFAEFVPTFFTSLDRFSWSHLWFVAYLFILSFVWLPALRAIARRPDTGGNRLSNAWVVVFLPILPLALVQIFLRPHWPGIQNLYDDWANIAYYSLFLLLGACLAADAAFEKLLQRQWLRALGVALCALLALLAAVLKLITSETVILALTAVAGWCFIVFLLGAAHRRAASESASLSYLAESSMPVYVLHQPAIVLVAWWIVGFQWLPMIKFIVILAGSFALTLAVYQLAVRRLAPLRFGFGMRERTKTGTETLRTALAVSATVLLLSLAATPVDAANETPVGLWWAEGGGAQVRLEPCGQSLCGRVVWVRSPFDENGCLLRDRHNPDATLRGRDVVGMEIVHGLAAADRNAGEWTGGTIYDPTSGRTYGCDLRVRDSNRLEIRGYFGLRILGRTVSWTRVGSEEQVCREPNEPRASP